MEQQFMKTAFFDFDGVVVDTEPIYDRKTLSDGNPQFRIPHQRDDIALYIGEVFFRPI